MPPSPVIISRHPLIADKLLRLRDKETPPAEFRRLIRQLAQLLFVEATSDLETKPTSVRTPLAECPGIRLASRIGFVPILRAGMGMAEAMLELVPDSSVWHIGVARNHETLQPEVYYERFSKLPPNLDIAFVLDPMLATGGSAIEAVARVKEWGVKKIRFIGLIAANEGIKALQKAHPKVPVYLGAIDSHLSEKGYIIPGLGDAGDREFGSISE
ncbi:uracil phosphoribosyltransferase [Tuwongella immobilis]|uniref:Uracil phosphoribosyltransferase n=1 Tax=Tuwongella immobilis TaxID=692036 RepID=A0A6C2YRA3_9BACT|nr:uracil phosphoribosyltransferase [Tuwongella immobilis]VIP03402.1 uracil phosphoribosyltransferase : Uracil phosphoribosyltransferase OS=Chloroflexus aurantiacus (strain ATCC 29364 / DSM 637 / Y-400-fl) GN=upp PE=3 SV=1: UPRTase [Tuwongella immobilis]VTS04176.1 uracil phosphoribosyltransferase : Uracil phosphoribosyltransferase OS=Chloroflexus aurantiacus (strain ATCC 29364 / DSM 637 / Y-400-fl) GN=upp PE=3 SV=1: UPRTase [Tuwongella immobilis]